MADALGAGRRQAREALEPILRYLVGKERYQIMHLQLRQLLRDEIGRRELDNRLWQLVEHCAHWRELADPTYALNHYAEHLYYDCHDRGALHALLTCD